jgi:hypothetical protein
MTKYFQKLISAKKNRASSVIWLVAAIILSPLSRAHAYLDPGTGSYAIQIAIGVIFGATYTLKSFGGRIVQYFKNRHPEKNELNE